MRTLLALSALIVVAATVALFVSARDTDRGAPARTGSVAMVGDSLNVGIEPYVLDDLDGWRFTRDDVVGRSTADGVDALQRAGRALGPVVIVSLGTNDAQGDVESFAANVAQAIEIVGPRRCLVWATIWRDGPNNGFNDVLSDAARANRNLVLVEWDAMVAKDPTLLADDGVHGTPEGYAKRARAVANAVRGCPPRPAAGVAQ